MTTRISFKLLMLATFVDSTCVVPYNRFRVSVSSITDKGGQVDDIDAAEKREGVDKEEFEFGWIWEEEVGERLGM